MFVPYQLIFYFCEQHLHSINYSYLVWVPLLVEAGEFLDKINFFQFLNVLNLPVTFLIHPKCIIDHQNPNTVFEI